MINPIEKTRLELLARGREILNLSSGNANESGLYFPEKILQKAFSEFITAPAYHPDPKGNLEARKAIVEFYKLRGLNISPDQIIITSGSGESYFHLFQYLAGSSSQTFPPSQKLSSTQPSSSLQTAPLKKTGEILFPNPSYPLFEEISGLSGTSLVYYQLNEKNGWQIDTADLQQKINQQTRAIVIISPDNPTGAVLSKKTILEVLSLAQKHHLAIISDEVFSEYIFGGKKFPRAASLSKKITIFTLNGLSKTYALPGFKLSWIVVTGPGWTGHMEALERPVDALLTANQIAQQMLPVIIRKGGPFIKKFQKYLEANHKIAISILKENPAISFHPTEGGFYLFAKIRLKRPSRISSNRFTTITDEQFVIRLMQQTGIFAHPGYFYDYDKDIFILISLLHPPKILERSLQKIVKFIETPWN